MIDRKAIKRYHRRVDERLAGRGKTFEGHRYDFNDKHDKLGRFAPKSGSGGGASGKTAEDMTAKDIKVHGPKESKKHIEAYLKAHPDAEKQIRADAKKYADAMKKVMRLKEDNPNAENASYNAVTGKKEDVNDGYCVTFHQNNKIGDEYGAYDDETYAMMIAVTKHELGSDEVYIGNFGNPEISFNCKDYQHAKRFCVEHNQHSIYDAKTNRLWKNPNWDESLNPIKGEGSNKDVE